ncbi:MAG: hypothetical protein CMP23_05875 [Rickettsiales bacterium]|nr:hypothetical protein [Rickettsiales bacterium]
MPKHLGDAVLCLGALRLLAAVPGSRVRLVCPSQLILDLLADQGSWQRGSAAFVSAKYSVAVLLAPSMRVALAARKAGLRQLIGLPSDGRGWLLSQRVAGPDQALPSQGLPSLLPGEHQADAYERVARHVVQSLVGTERFGPADRRYTLGAPGRDRGRDAWLSTGRPTLLLHPYSAGLATKRWAMNDWLELGRLLRSAKARPIVTGGPGDEDYRLAAELGTALEAPVLAGDSTLSPAAWVSLADCVGRQLLCDTGLAHLAAAAGLEPIVLFGPTDPARHAPSGGTVVWGGRDLSCAPCYRSPCAAALPHACMGHDPDEVAGLLKLRAGPPPGAV